MAVAFDFLRFWLNAPSWATIFETVQAALAIGTTTCLASRRTHPCASCNVALTIHKLDRANKVTNCAVFFFKPR